MIDIIALRRELHQYPELGFTEFRTATKVVQMLTALGYRVTYGKDAIDDTSRRGCPNRKCWKTPISVLSRKEQSPL